MYHESDPDQAGYPTLKRLHGKIWPRLKGQRGLVDRATRLGGLPHLSCKHDQIKLEIIWTGGLPHLSELPYFFFTRKINKDIFEQGVKSSSDVKMMKRLTFDKLFSSLRHFRLNPT